MIKEQKTYNWQCDMVTPDLEEKILWFISKGHVIDHVIPMHYKDGKKLVSAIIIYSESKRDD